MNVVIDGNKTKTARGNKATELLEHISALFTKEEVIAILTELQLGVEELDSRAGYSGGGMPTFSTDYIRKKKVNELIQQKINKLKGENNGQES